MLKLKIGDDIRGEIMYGRAKLLKVLYARRILLRFFRVRLLHGR